MTGSDTRKICNLDDDAFETRRKELRRTLFRRIRGREAIPDGVALRFEATARNREDLRDFLAFEKECCPTLALSAVEKSRGILLEVRGIDPESDLLADAGIPIDAVVEARIPHRRGRLLRSIGLGGSAALVLCCLLPIAVAGLAGGGLVAPLTGLDDPWAIGFSGAFFAVLFWLRDGRRRQGRGRPTSPPTRTSDSASGCGC